MTTFLVHVTFTSTTGVGNGTARVEWDKPVVEVEEFGEFLAEVWRVAEKGAGVSLTVCSIVNVMKFPLGA